MLQHAVIVMVQYSYVRGRQFIAHHGPIQAIFQLLTYYVLSETNSAFTSHQEGKWVNLPHLTKNLTHLTKRTKTNMIGKRRLSKNESMAEIQQFIFSVIIVAVEFLPLHWSYFNLVILLTSLAVTNFFR